MTIKPTCLLLLSIAVLASPVQAQDDSLAQSGEPPQRTSVLYTYGDEPCPEPEGNEIVVCAQQPESERYRVPKELREEIKDDTAVGGGSWASRVEGYDNIARQTRPDSCSPVGSYGYTGCAALALRQWFEARRAR
ncbi:MAG: hypothetical protein CVT78_02790 [Alphaproteobacteria bacterium HGW-Alphaproteobacteria-17]|nr:MAG: hypothetical protein CVT78_02790 [Alphaproteobacteria bacterium HGW-Alphaproteobacteria-17]